MSATMEILGGPLFSKARCEIISYLTKQGGKAIARDIWRNCGLNSGAALVNHLEVLERAGFVKVNRIWIEDGPRNGPAKQIEVTDAGRKAMAEQCKVFAELTKLPAMAGTA